jgi:hypothetical protein
MSDVGPFASFIHFEQGRTRQIPSTAIPHHRRLRRTGKSLKLLLKNAFLELCRQICGSAGMRSCASLAAYQSTTPLEGALEPNRTIHSEIYINPLLPSSSLKRRPSLSSNRSALGDSTKSSLLTAHHIAHAHCQLSEKIGRRSGRVIVHSS